uniref:SOCS box domain-containing protein n=1 Tax=Schistocephalus solidus TaxID=70667 RepID=A0A0V0J5R6_SCHSO
MGVEESKLSNSYRYGDHICCQQPSQTGKQWSIIHNCHLDVWKKEHYELFNFSNKVLECPYSVPNDCTHSFCLSRQNILNLSKRNHTFSLRKHKKHSKIAEHFEYNHIPAHLSSIQNLHFKSILCSRNGLAIVHLARNFITQFGIVDMQINKFLGTFGRQSVKYSPESVAAQISPDCSWCLIRMPWSRNNRVTTLQLYNLRTRDLLVELPLCLDSQSREPEAPLESPMPLLEAWIEETNAERLRSPLSSSPWQPHQSASAFAKACGGYSLLSTSLPSTPTVASNATANRRAVGVRALGCFNRPASVVFDFDPRFLNSRIVIANVNFLKPCAAACAQLPPADMFGVPAPVLSLVRLPTWEQLAKTRNFGGLELVPPADRLNATPAAGHRRRRASMDATQMTIAPSGVNILKVFYSRAGHLIFALVTNTFNCRCSSMNSVFSFCASVPSPSPSSSSPAMPAVAAGGAGVGGGGSSPCGTLSSSAQQAVRDSPLQCLRCTHPTGADGTSDSMEGTSSVALDSFSSRARLSAHHHSHQHQHQQLNSGNSQASALTLTTATGGYPPPPGCTSLFLLVFNSDSLDLLRLLRFDRPICPLHTCPTNYVPTMSRCGSRIAVVTMVTAVAAGGTSGGTHARTLVTLRGGNSQGRSAKTGRKITFSSHASLTAATSGEFAGVDFATPRRRAADGRTNQAVQSWTDQGSRRDHYWNEATIRNSLTEEYSHQLQLHHHNHHQHHHQQSQHSQSAFTRRVTVSSCVAGDATIIANTHLTQSVPNATTVEFGFGGVGQPWRRTDAVLVYQLEPPPTLQAIVREKIVQYFPDSMLDQLGLPPSIVTFLRFKPSFACSGSCLSRSESSTLTMRSTSLDLL